MVNVELVKKLALAFEAVEELPHFEKTSFRIKKKIFATLDEGKELLVLKLSEVNQSVFCAFDPQIIYPVAGAWGKKGWTAVELSDVREDLLQDALTQAYCEVAPKKLAAQYILKEDDF